MPPPQAPRPPVADTDGQPTPSPVRALGLGSVAAAILALVLAVLGGPASFSAGLVVVAFFMGRLVGAMVKFGAAGTLSSPARVSLAILISLAGIAAGQLGIWLFARGEGGVLDVGTYLASFGPLVPLEFMIATLSAWWSAR
ncbi:MAG TPA: hypothetical protein VFS32_05740 [Candidatus Limnocylindrales bacterium]|nr:hypothetical protein [Candidatus Limnocylindrales bacterium]